ncbi:MAG: hypothetical protein AB7G75_03585 [Candidatus Binatia bacterium]
MSCVNLLLYEVFFFLPLLLSSPQFFGDAAGLRFSMEENFLHCQEKLTVKFLISAKEQAWLTGETGCQQKFTDK